MDTDRDTQKANRFMLGVEIYSRLRPELDERAASRPTGPAAANAEPAVPAGPDLAGLLKRLAPIPHRNLLVGCSAEQRGEGLPILLDLSQPEPGSLLLLGSAGSGKTRLLKAMLASGCLTNSPRSFRFCVLGPAPERLNPLPDRPHCYKTAIPSKDTAHALVVELVNLAEERRYGRQLGAAIVLAIVDLPQTLAQLSPEICDLLVWLVRYGPQSQVFTLATLDAADYRSIEPAALRAFGGWLVGSLHADAEFCRQYVEFGMAASRLEAGAQFCVFHDNQWVPFWIPGFNG